MSKEVNPIKWEVVFLFLFIPCLASPSFQEFSIIADVGLSHVSEQVEITVFNDSPNQIDVFNFSLGHSPGDVYAEVDGVKVEPKLIDNGDTWLLEFDLDLKPEEASKILLRFRADSLVKNTDQGKNFQFTFSPQYPVQDFRLRVILPAGAVLMKERRAAQSQPVVFPEAAVSSDGREVAVEWNLDDFKDDKVFLINYELPFSGSQNNKHYWVVLLVLFVIVLAFYSTRVQWNSTIKALDEDKKKVMDLVRKQPGLAQRDIVEATGFNKVKVHREVKRLTDSNLVRVEKRGNTNRIFLSERLEGVLNPFNSFKSFFLNLKDNLLPDNS